MKETKINESSRRDIVRKTNQKYPFYPINPQTVKIFQNTKKVFF